MQLKNLQKNLSFKCWTIVLLNLLLVDQLSKLLFVNYYKEYVHYNTGIAFSLPLNINFPIIIALLVIGIIVSLKLKKILTYDWLWAVFIAGTIGNLIDRIRINAVIDFINLGWFPIFNIADIYLTCSAIAIAYLYTLKNKV